MKSEYIVFYSWQSDSPKETNQNAIRQCLRAASSTIENELDEIKITLDEATRSTTGSPNIPNTIFDKIYSSDVFICDLTTINPYAPADKRKVGNPNVLIELGYAIAVLGWERILLLFNKEHGDFPTDLPFDIDRHRANPFNIKSKTDNNGKANLTRDLTQATKAIIIADPKKPHEKRELKPEERKRQIDINNLRWAMSIVHIPTFDNFIEEIPELIIGRIFFFKDGYVGIMESSTFHIYNQLLLEKMTLFKNLWSKSLSFAQHYGPDFSGRNYRFHMVMDMFTNESAEKDFHEIVKIRQQLKDCFQDLLNYIREEYLEIDLEETSKLAFDEYKEIITEN